MDRAMLILLVLALPGCSTVTPETFGAKPQEVRMRWSGPVAVASAHTGDPASRFNANGMVFEVDLAAFSEHLAELVRDSLRDSGVTIGAGEKEIRVSVEYLDFMFQGPCLVDYTVELGAGDRFGLQSTGASSNFQTACRAALQAAVLHILQDPRTVEYVGGE